MDVGLTSKPNYLAHPAIIRLLKENVKKNSEVAERKKRGYY